MQECKYTQTGNIICTGVEPSFLVTSTMNWAYKHGALLSKFSCWKTVVKYTSSSQHVYYLLPGAVTNFNSVCVPSVAYIFVH